METEIKAFLQLADMLIGFVGGCYGVFCLIEGKDKMALYAVMGLLLLRFSISVLLA